MEEEDSLSSLKAAGPSPPTFGTDSRADTQMDGRTDSALSLGYKSISEDVEDRIRREGHDPHSITDGGKIAFLVEQLQVRSCYLSLSLFLFFLSIFLSFFLSFFQSINQ